MKCKDCGETMRVKDNDDGVQVIAISSKGNRLCVKLDWYCPNCVRYTRSEIAFFSKDK